MMFEAFRSQLEQLSPGCISESTQTDECKTKLKYSIDQPAPTFFTLNLNWEANPDGQTVLKLFLSIPQIMQLEQLYDVENGVGRPYKLRALIVFSHNHYYIYLRQ